MIVTTFDVKRAQYALEVRSSEGTRPGKPFWNEKPDPGLPWRTPADMLPVIFRIIATTEAEALAAAASVSQSPPEGWGWKFRVISVSQHVEPDREPIEPGCYAVESVTRALCVRTSGHEGNHKAPDGTWWF